MNGYAIPRDWDSDQITCMSVDYPGTAANEKGRTMPPGPGSASLPGGPAHFISASVCSTIWASPSLGVTSPRITLAMMSRWVRQMRTELPPG